MKQLCMLVGIGACRIMKEINLYFSRAWGSNCSSEPMPLESWKVGITSRRREPRATDFLKKHAAA
jgi:hypothetical protein